MKYDASHMKNPGPRAAGRLCNYVTQNGAAATFDKRGRPIGDEEMNGFYGVANGAGSSAMHTFAFTEDIPRDDLVGGIRGPARDHLDGHYVIGIHEDTERNHIHIGEAGDYDDLTMGPGDVRAFASDVADSIGVSYG